MRGLTPEQFVEILAFVQKHHRFALYIPPDERREERKKLFPKLPVMNGFGIKYVDCIYDSRGGDIWAVSFRFGNAIIRFSTNHFTALSPAPKGWKYDNLYDWCMAYLTGEFVPKEEFYFKEK
jgi:hypothetical protein